jgi:ABC-type transport system involved in cytochrome bd biosynthesis fused ATPase/permease subunit
MPDAALIEVESLTFRWPSADLPCLVIKSFQVSAGERVFLFGPSGSGFDAPSRAINPYYRAKFAASTNRLN